MQLELSDVEVVEIPGTGRGKPLGGGWGVLLRPAAAALAVGPGAPGIVVNCAAPGGSGGCCRLPCNMLAI